jgi:hypothetical protein
VKDLKTGSNSESCLYISYWYVDKALTINGQLKWKEDVTGSGWTETRNHDEQWNNLTLKPGWNKVQRGFSRVDDSTDSSNIKIDISETCANAPDDISDFKWTLDTPRS